MSQEAPQAPQADETELESDVEPPEEISSIFRIISDTPDGELISFYDLNNSASMWVNAFGYEGEDDIIEFLQEVEPGNVVEADLVYDEDADVFNIVSADVLEDSRLYYIQTDGWTFAPSDDWWSESGEEDVIVGVWRNDDGDPIYEVHVHAQELDNYEGDVIDAYEGVLSHQFILDPYYEGSELEHFDQAKAIIMVDPKGKDYIEFYIFPAVSRHMMNVWNEYSDHMAEPDQF